MIFSARSDGSDSQVSTQVSGAIIPKPEEDRERPRQRLFQGQAARCDEQSRSAE